ncbi:hypothetical protein [Leptothoe sp. PORK10 BA2]|nr:hypothetical protein [Leptothoe sp. PORK10 BA2]MEA5466744.1 hypothetical protein [Leptothoe sp. PORK10 BA2]
MFKYLDNCLYRYFFPFEGEYAHPQGDVHASVLKFAALPQA